MTEDATQIAAAGTPSTADIVADAPTARRCPWCSELLPEGALERCPSCKANLIAGGEARIAGLTEVETATATRVRRAEAPRRSKLLSWISGDVDDEPASVAPSAPDALDPPARDVRREMLRLKLEAEGINVAADGSIALPGGPRPVADATAEVTTPADGPTAVEDDSVDEPSDLAAPEIRKAS
jgi:hypothetical protein